MRKEFRRILEDEEVKKRKAVVWLLSESKSPLVELFVLTLSHQ